MHCSFVNLTAKTALKYVDFDEVTDKTSWLLFVAHGVDASNRNTTKL